MPNERPAVKCNQRGLMTDDHNRRPHFAGKGNGFFHLRIRLKAIDLRPAK
jgi:hypothetical protein